MDARQPGIDHTADAVDGDRRLGDIRRHDDATAPPGMSGAAHGPVLFGGAQAAVQGEHIGRAVGVAQPPTAGLDGATDLVGAREEHQRIPLAAAVQPAAQGAAGSFPHGCVGAALVVTDLHGKGAPLGAHGRAGQVLGDGGRF
jgi:hypothetical protein